MYQHTKKKTEKEVGSVSSFPTSFYLLISRQNRTPVSDLKSQPVQNPRTNKADWKHMVNVNKQSISGALTTRERLFILLTQSRIP